MDAAPRGLAPSGPGVTGAPLVDWILADPGLARAVFANLAPRDVLGLRSACKGACSAVAGHAWESGVPHAWAGQLGGLRPPPPPPPPLDVRVRAAAEKAPPRLHAGEGGDHDAIGRADLARWRACFPSARSVVVSGGRLDWDDADAIADADLEALAATGSFARLGLVACSSLVDGALAPFTRLTSLALADVPWMTGACWAHLAGRLRSVAVHDCGTVTDDHLPALAGCTRVSLGSGATVTDAGVAAHLSRSVTHLALDLGSCYEPPFDGSCLRSCRGLVDLRLRLCFDTALVPDALAGCAAVLERLELTGMNNCGIGALLAAGGGGLPALRSAALLAAQTLTDAAFHECSLPRLAELAVAGCHAFAGGPGVGPLRALERLEVRNCARFTGRALTAACMPRLRWLAVLECPRCFAEPAAAGGDSGRELPLAPAAPPAPALPLLAGAHVAGSEGLTDAWFADTPALTHLALERCPGVAGGAVLADRLHALAHLAVDACNAFTGAWLGGGGSARLESLALKDCPALVLADALAPGPHPRLRRATLSGDSLEVTDDDLLGSRLTGVRELAVMGCDGFVGGPGLRLPRLERLIVQWCPDFTGGCLPGAPALASLDVRSCPRVGGVALAAAAAGCPALATVTYRNYGIKSRVRMTEQPLPCVPPAALGRGWAAVSLGDSAWSATRSVVAAAAAAAEGSHAGVGGEGAAAAALQQERQDDAAAASPPAKRARAGVGE